MDITHLKSNVRELLKTVYYKTPIHRIETIETGPFCDLSPLPPEQSQAIQEAMTAVIRHGFGFGGWALAKQSILHFCFELLKRGKPGKPLQILELGSGVSTVFWSELAPRLPNRLAVTSIEHSPFWYEKMLPFAREGKVTLERYPLYQVADAQHWSKLIRDEGFVTQSWPKVGTLVDEKEYTNTRLKNAFYGVSNAQVTTETIDGMIVDGPNGNGRELSFGLFANKLRPGSLILVDDYVDYPFLDTLRMHCQFKKLVESRPWLGKRWILVEVTQSVS